MYDKVGGGFVSIKKGGNEEITIRKNNPRVKHSPTYFRHTKNINWSVRGARNGRVTLKFGDPIRGSGSLHCWGSWIHKKNRPIAALLPFDLKRNIFKATWLRTPPLVGAVSRALGCDVTLCEGVEARWARLQEGMNKCQCKGKPVKKTCDGSHHFISSSALPYM